MNQKNNKIQIVQFIYFRILIIMLKRVFYCKMIKYLLIQIADQSNDIAEVQECVKILSQSFLMNQLKLDQDIVQKIERLIQHKDMQITNKIIKAYTKIIVQKKYEDLTITVDPFLSRKIKDKKITES
ncbi:unnamed protein product [Paramecium sonneborni]|uniref:Uncharacterized protein n=1 Tax=Paramecium sonneborni TaxID=65129 RepID=A0A8S1NY84_9CILI|nr:unnamed protein product [Paramecium sonneborni]